MDHTRTAATSPYEAGPGFVPPVMALDAFPAEVDELRDPPGPYVVLELSLSVTAEQVEAEEAAGRGHPERTPVGPFPTRQAADEWASAWIARWGGSGSWSIGPLKAPPV